MRDPSQVDPINKWTLETVWPFGLTILVLLGSMWVSLEILSSVRAFVTGESRWAKGQKQAHIAL